jgi:methionine-rich copper-binding protein CopC
VKPLLWKIAYIGTSAIGTVTWASSVSAHAYLVDSFPAAKQHLDRPIDAFKLNFAGSVDAHYSSISLERVDGSVIAERTQQKISPRLELRGLTLSPGLYRLHYRVLSTDGDVVEGRVEFAVDR